MTTDLSNRVDGVPERFDPVSMRGELTEAEHIVRYAWAAQLARGKRVLDAGCGLAYGTLVLARGGAAEVVGVDVAEAVIEAARATAGAEVQLRVGDLRALDFEDGRFDLVVCLEVIEHLEEREQVLAELRRTLAPGGVLVVSSPNRSTYVPGNPHHVREFAPEELRATLSESFARVALWRQHDWIMSAVLTDDALAADDLEVVPGLTVGKVAGVAPGEETYTLALASDGDLPAPAATGMITGTVELRKWLDLYDEQQAILRRQHEHFATLAEQADERLELRRQLVAAERETARIGALEQERDEERARADRLASQIPELERRAAHSDALVRAVVSSPSWRITAPLRALKRMLRR